MKNYKTYIAWLVSAVAACGAMTSCQDDIDAPAMNVPVAELTPNTTIAEFKNTFWNDAANYADTVGTKEDGSHYIIHGTVVSSDEAGNVFKYIVIQDETGAVNISINSYNLYLSYRRGQEIVLDCTGMYVGKYAGLFQFGYPSFYENGSTWQVGFMAPEFFAPHVELNGLPEVADIDTLTVNGFAELSTTPEGLRKWQSQLVRFNNVEFTNGGKADFSVYHTTVSADQNQNLVDADGNTIVVRTSGYANFATKRLPAGRGDVVGILGYYETLSGSTTWQLALIDEAGCMNFGNPTIAPGAESNPWTVDQAIEVESNSTTVKEGWVTGYIVGAVAPEITEVKSNSDIEWTSTPVLDNTLVIAQSPDTKDINHALVLNLTIGSELYRLGNLANNPDVYGKQIWIKGRLEKEMGTYGITGNNGSAGTWRIDGVESGTPQPSEGDGTQNSPFSVPQVIAFNPSSSTDAVKTGVWVNGYIVGWADLSTTFVINQSTAQFNANATLATNILVGPTPDCTDISKCIGVQLPTGSVRQGLNLKDNPGNFGKVVKLKGDIAKYSGIAGVRNTSEFEIVGSGPVTPPTPSVVTSIDENFDASTSIPAGWTQAQVAGNKSWYVPTFNNNNYAAMTGYKGTAPFDQWLFTPGVDMSKVTNKTLKFRTQVNGYGAKTTKLEVYVLNSTDPATATKTKLNPALASAPASGYSDWVESGSLDLSAFSGTIYIGFRYTATADANYATWCVDNVQLNASGGSTPDPGPVTPTGDYKGDFNSFNGGQPKASPYGTYTNATGWTAQNAIILSGTDDASASNPYFPFIGKAGTLGVVLNGKTGAAGLLTSPVLKGGCGKLSFSYGFPFSDTKCAFTVRVKNASGSVVKEQQVNIEKVEKLKAFSFELDVNAAGDFSVEIVNNCISAATANKDRVCIWNLTWTAM